MARKINLANDTSCACIGVNLRKAIYATAEKLCATDVVINKVVYDKWAQVELFEHGHCIDWKYEVEV